ncbi:MAG: hypothetical protein AB7Q81_16995 [Gammaproteobacteria bacterium]
MPRLPAILLVCLAAVLGSHGARAADDRSGLGMSTSRDRGDRHDAYRGHSYRSDAYPRDNQRFSRDHQREAQSRQPLSQRRAPDNYERQREAYRDGYRDGFRDGDRGGYGIRGGVPRQGYGYPSGGGVYRRSDPYQPYGHAPGYDATPRFDYPSLNNTPSVPQPLRRYPADR